MRRFVESLEGERTSLLEGIKAHVEGGWVLLRPDRVAPRLHLHVQGSDAATASGLLARYRAEVEALIRST
jgi:phosphomannomutase